MIFMLIPMSMMNVPWEAATTVVDLLSAFLAYQVLTECNIGSYSR